MGAIATCIAKLANLGFCPCWGCARGPLATRYLDYVPERCTEIAGGEQMEQPPPGVRYAERADTHEWLKTLTLEGGAAPILPGTPKAATAIDLAFQGEDMLLPARLTPPALGNKAGFVILQARMRNVPVTHAASPVEFSRDWMAAGGTLAVSDLKVKWGPLDMKASGEVTLDEKGRPAGRLEAEIADYEGLVSALVKAGRIPRKNEKMALAGLGLISQFQGNKSGRVRVPVVMSEGKLYLGPVPVARLDPVY